MVDAVLLQMRGIDKRFAGVPALRGASFVVGPAEVHGLVGENGAGKSTLIKILTGYYRRDGGEVMFAGQPLHVVSPQAAQAAGISTIYQEINLVGLRSVTENICLGREQRRMGLLDWPRMHDEAAALLARFGVKIDVRRKLQDFSTATQQMVAIARAVGFAARLVIMDEPTSSLSDREIEVLFGVIRQLRAQGVSVVFVSHKLDELYAVCDRVTIMRDGRTVRTAAMSDLSRLDLVATMLGRDAATVARQGTTGFGSKSGESADRVLLTVAELAAPPQVRDVSLQVKAGEIVGLSGLLGSGRTETARLLFGVAQANSGTLAMHDKPFAPRSPHDAIAAGIGFCTEDRKTEGIIPEMSVRENLTLALLPALSHAGVVDEAAQARIVAKYIERLDIRCSSPDQPVRTLSGGNQQKVLLARWLCLDPRLLILDEPTRGIDVGAKAEIQALIRELAADGLGVLMISSEVEEIVEGADRAYVMRDGRSVAELGGAALTENAVMTAIAHGEAGSV
jgi:ribose transport system ATP-binding protein